MTSAFDLVELRLMREADLHYIHSSWMRSYTSKSADVRALYGGNSNQFSIDFEPVVRALIGRSQVLVAAMREDADVIVAWAAFEGEALHYVLTKPRWRRMGIAKWLLADFASKPLAYTHRTDDSKQCPVPSGWTYRRGLIWPARETAA